MKLYRITALLLKYFYISINRIDRLFDIFYWPVLDVVLWGFASAYIEDLSSYNILSMLMGGVILWTFIWRSSQDMGVYVLEDFWSRTLYHLFSSPVKISEHMISIITLGFLRGCASFTILTIVAYLMHSFNIFTELPLKLLVISIFLLSLFGWAMGLFVSGFIFRYGKRIQVLAWSIVWIIQPFSCVFYPMSALPEWAVGIAKFMPTTYIFENLRNAIFNETINYGQLWYSFFSSLVLITLMAGFLKQSFEKARTTGLLANAE